MALKKGLSENGFIVDLAFEGQEGLFLAQENNYDLIVLDIIRFEYMRFKHWTSSEGKPFLLMSSPIEYDHNGKITKRMKTALDTSYPQNLIGKTTHYILIFFILLVLIFLSLVDSQ